MLLCLVGAEARQRAAASDDEAESAEPANADVADAGPPLIDNYANGGVGSQGQLPEDDPTNQPPQQAASEELSDADLRGEAPDSPQPPDNYDVEGGDSDISGSPIASATQQAHASQQEHDDAAAGAPPEVDGVDPANGPTKGGTIVTIAGRNFGGGDDAAAEPAVTVGGAACLQVILNLKQ